MDAHAGREESWRPQTRLVRGGLRRSAFCETSEAIYATSGFVYDDAEEAEAAFANRVDRYIYSRYDNPTVGMFEDRLRLIEGAEACRATASGMAAVFASLACMVEAGDHVVGARALFGSCLYILTDILPRLGVQTTVVESPDTDAWAAALDRPTRAVFLESPSNPGLDIFDIRAISKLAHDAGAMVIIDNVFATPLLQRPLELGADIVVYSATKHIDGQGRCLGGAVLGSEEYCMGTLKTFMRHTGPSMSPFNAWVLLKGWRPCSFAWTGTAGPRSTSRPRWPPAAICCGCSIPVWRATPSTPWPRRRCPVSAASSPSISRAARSAPSAS